MKRTLLTMLAITALAFTANLLMAQTFTYPVKGQQGFSLTEKTRDGMRISYQLGQFSMSQLNYRGEEMSEISINGIALPNVAGSPNLPTESRMMAIPQGAKATLNVVHADRQVIKNVNIAPALRIQAETEEPDMDYKKDMKVYAKNAFYPENPFVMGESYIRGVNAVTVAITPFQYNPVTKELAVYTNIELSISYEGGNGHFGEDRLRSPYWDPILAAELMNYDQLPVIDYEARMQEWLRDGAEGAEYLIITPNNDAWAPYAQQLKEYRMKQGILTEVYRLDEMPATTTTAMRQWFHNAYHNWEIAPVAVCLLGDHGSNMGQYIPAETTSHPYDGSCITDNKYADAEGNDNLPDMVFSRLIAQNANELPVFVSKQIEYEYTNPNMDPSFYTSPITALGWQTERWFQLCSEVFGGYMRNHGYTPTRINCIYSGTPGSIWSEAQNTSQVTNYFGPSGTNYIPASPEELGGWTGGSPDQVVQAVNSGAFWLQHRDHGLETGWGEPAVRNSHVEQMNNVGKMPFVMSINCLTGKFDYSSDCFCEAWMRRTYNGQNAGAVGVLCPTEVSYSFVNDAFVWGVYDLFDGDFMPTMPTSNYTYGPATPKTGNWMPAFGNVAGKYFLYNCSWPYNDDDKDITYTMFTAHCDAFLRIYTQVPQSMTVNHQSVQLAGLQTFQITAPEGTTIALTKGEGEELEIVAVASATGSLQNIEIPSQVPPTVLKLTVTGQNYLRYEADIEVIPADGPYVIVNSYALINQAPQLNFGDESGFDLVLKNVGNTQAPAGSATLTTDSEYVTITNGTVSFDAISSNNTLSLSNAFTFTISDEVPNKTSIVFTVSITSGNDTYESHINIKAYAPVFKIGNVSIQEINGNGNGRLDPGEIAKLIFPIENKGNADSRQTDVILTMNNVFLQLTDPASTTINSIAAESTTHVEFQVNVGNAPSGFAAEYTLDVVDGVYTDARDFATKIGLNVEDFEQNQLDPTLWTNNSTSPWTFTNESPYEGNYCIRSGNINDNGETAITLTYQVAETDSIAFYYKVSSEGTYDKLIFYIDNQEKGNWSGSVEWSFARYPVTAGNHTFRWKYKKDVSVSSGSDCAWIDFVILPRDMSLAASAGLDIDVCEGEAAQVLGYASNYQSILWTTSGDGSFDDATIANPIYTPGAQDIANGNATLTITVTGSGNQTITDDMTVTIFRAVGISYGLLELDYCAVSEPQVIVVNVEGDYASFLWTTSGNGEFENANELFTTYTPSAEDIEAGSVTLYATATSESCDPVTLEYPFEMHPLPVMLLETESIDICEGEPAIMNFSASNGAGFVIINGDQPYQINESTTSIDLGLLTVGTTVFNINEIQGYMPCSVNYDDGEFTFTVNVTPKAAVPEMSGDTEVDVRITSTSTYAITNDVMVEYTFEPTAAGTMIVANDGQSVEITWSETYKGEAVLTATPIDECNNGTSTLNITVKNSTDVNEMEAKAKIYPNPTSEKVNIECEGMTHVSVFNTIGQLVYDADVNADRLSIDMTPFPAGSYMVRITTSSGTYAKHLNVIR